MAEESKLQEMIRTSLESIRTMVDANTVVGTPISTPSGTTIIPISKVSVGYASGGTDFGKSDAAKNFAGGGGTGLTVQPVCFIAVNAAGDVELIPLGEGDPSTASVLVAKILEKTPEFLGKFKGIWKNKKKKKEEAEAEAEDVTEAVIDAAAEAAEKATQAAAEVAMEAAAETEELK